MFCLSGGNHILREEQTANQFQLKVDWIHLRFAIGEIQGCISTSEIGVHLISLAIQFSSHGIRGQDGSWDLRGIISPDKLVLAGTTAWNFEITNTSWYVYRVVRHFQSRGFGTFLISILTV